MQSQKLGGLTNLSAALLIVPFVSVLIADAVMLQSNDHMAAFGFTASALLFVITYNLGMMSA